MKHYNNRCCDSCGSTTKLLVKKGKYLPLKCKRCGLVQSMPMPSDQELMLYYEGFKFQPPKEETMNDEIERIARSIASFVSPSKFGNFLDYGGGFGLYAEAAAKLDYIPTLFDYDKEALAFAAKKFPGVNVCQSFEALPEKHFDIVWAFHVIEHWNALLPSLMALRKLLKPNGVIVLATPNAKSWEKYLRPSHFRRYYRLWREMGLSRFRTLCLLLKFDSVFCWDPPRHLYAFTPKSIVSAANRIGMRADIRVGPNTNLLFEPRSYVVNNGLPTARWRFEQFLAGKGRRFSISAISELYTTLSFSVLERVFPSGGEQLYAILRENT